MPLSEEQRRQALAAVGRLSRAAAAWPGNVRELLTFLKRCVLGVEEQECLLLGEWMRRRRSDAAGPLASSITPPWREQAPLPEAEGPRRGSRSPSPRRRRRSARRR